MYVIIAPNLKFFWYNVRMRKKQADMTAVCLNFCPYYKPGKKEEITCEGYAAVRRLLGEGKDISLRKREARSAPGPELLQKLRERICSACAFREADCDFILTLGEAPSCGGFTLLARLLTENKIVVEDL